MSLEFLGEVLRMEIGRLVNMQRREVETGWREDRGGRRGHSPVPSIPSPVRSKTISKVSSFGKSNEADAVSV